MAAKIIDTTELLEALSLGSDRKLRETADFAENLHVDNTGIRKIQETADFAEVLYQDDTLVPRIVDTAEFMECLYTVITQAHLVPFPEPGSAPVRGFYTPAAQRSSSGAIKAERSGSGTIASQRSSAGSKRQERSQGQ